MNEKHLKQLREQIKALGFPERIAEDAGHYIKANTPEFDIYYHKQTEEDQLTYKLSFSNVYEQYRLTQYELTLKEVVVPELNIGGISTRDLDKKLKEVDGWYDKFQEPDIESNMSKEQFDKVTTFISSTNNELFRLAEFKEGEEAAQLLMFKYLPQNEFETFFAGYHQLQQQYEHKRAFPVDGHATMHSTEAYLSLKQESKRAELSASNCSIEGHILSEEALQQFNRELHQGNQWLAYNCLSPFLEMHDMFFFSSKEEANDFAQCNISDVDNYCVIHSRQLTTAGDEIVLQQTILPIQNTTTMNQKNLDYLSDQVKFTGFGEALESALKEKMQKQVPEFQLYHNTKFGNDIATATLHFKKSEQSEMYFFNKYDLTLKQEISPDMMKQTFYINKANNITLKEAYNMMSGRAVNKDLTNKEGQVYNAWLQMDFKETDKNGNFQLKKFHQNYGYDLVKELAKYPIKELAAEQDRERLMESLEKGNRQAVTFLKDGQEQRMYVEANPRFKSLNVYDSNMQRVHSQSQKEKSVPEQSLKQEAKKESRKQSADDEGSFAEPKQKRSRKKGQSIG